MTYFIISSTQLIANKHDFGSRVTCMENFGAEVELEGSFGTELWLERIGGEFVACLSVCIFIETKNKLGRVSSPRKHDW